MEKKSHRDYVDDALHGMIARAMREAVALERMVVSGKITRDDMVHDVGLIIADAVNNAAVRIHLTVDEV